MKEVADSIIEILKDMRRFLWGPNTHPAWPALVADMPEDLKAAVDAVAHAERVQKMRSEDLYQAEGRLLAAEANLDAARKRQDAESVLQQLDVELAFARTEHEAARRAYDDSIVAWQDSGREHGQAWLKMGVYEREKQDAWLRDRSAQLEARASELAAAVSPHMNELQGLDSRKGLSYRDFVNANSATEVLLKLAASVVAAPEAAKRDVDLKELKSDVTHELAKAVRGSKKKEAAPRNGEVEVASQVKLASGAIDATALDLLTTAVSGGGDATQAYIPTQEAMAEAVTKKLGRKIRVEALFGTRAKGSPERYRYPKFMAMWRAIQANRERQKDARRPDNTT